MQSAVIKARLTHTKILMRDSFANKRFEIPSFDIRFYAAEY